MKIRAATIADLPVITEIHNHYVVNTHITFDVRPFQPDEREPWFRDHSDGKRHRILVAVADETSIVGYACTGAFRSKEAYATTVEASVACRPNATGNGIGSRLYEELFVQLATQDVHRIVAAIAQPNEASNRLHKRFGFHFVGTFSQVGRKFGKYWDVLWMEKRLGPK